MSPTFSLKLSSQIIGNFEFVFKFKKIRNTTIRDACWLYLPKFQFISDSRSTDMFWYVKLPGTIKIEHTVKKIRIPVEKEDILIR